MEVLTGLVDCIFVLFQLRGYFRPYQVPLPVACCTKWFAETND